MVQVLGYLSVLLVVMPMHLAIFQPMFLAFTIFCTPFWFLGLAYVAWMIYDKDTPNKGGRPNPMFRSLPTLKFIADYYKLKLVKTAELDPSKNYILCSHPHGVFAQGATYNFQSDITGVSKVFPGLRTHVVTVNADFSMPFERDLLLYWRGFSSSSEKNLSYLMNDPKGGNAPVLCVGGVLEALDAHPGRKEYIINLKRRRGFVRVALKTGASLVPVFTFGENELHEQVANPEGSLLRQFQNFLLRKTGIPYPVLKNYVPKSVPLTTVVGSPIHCEKIANPTDSDVEGIHSKFVEDLKSLFYAHRDACGESDREIRIV